MATAKPKQVRATSKAAEVQQRAIALAAQTIVNRYDAGGTGRRMKGFNPPSSGPNRAIENLPLIRNRSRDIVRNDWAGKSGQRVWTTGLIGVGIVPRFNKALPKDRRAELTSLFKRWFRMCDANGASTFFGLQTLMTKAWLGGGECFIRKRYRRADSGLEIPMQIQLLESEFVPQLDTDSWPGLPRGNQIQQGVEFNRIGARVAMWCYKDHPGDKYRSTPTYQELVRVPIDSIHHLFEPERPGQIRGVPDFAAIIARLRSIGDFDDATLERQKIANLFAVFLEQATTGTFDLGVDPLTGRPIDLNSVNEMMVGLEPGLLVPLRPGEKMSFATPPPAGTTYSEYMRTQNLGTAAGQGVPYELQSGDIQDVSDRTLRVIINEFRRFAEQRQWQIVIPACQALLESAIDQAVLAGTVTVKEAEVVKDVEWSPHGWDYMHPEQDVKAKILEVDAGFRSRSSVIAARGDDPMMVDDERVEDKKRADDLGLTVVPVDPKAASSEDDDEPKKPIKDLMSAVGRLETAFQARADRDEQGEAFEHFIAGLSETNKSITMIAQSVVALAARPLEVNVANTVEPAPVNNVVNVEPAPVNNVVNVEPTPVNVNVEPAPPTPIENHIHNEVIPEVTVNLPTRQIETDVIERDPATGELKKVVQTERTIN